MRDLIKKILKEDEDDGFDWTDSEINPPRNIIRDAGRRFKWSTYIPILGKKIMFYFNPEHWNLMANIRIYDIESKGHGSFGDDPHKEYTQSVLSDLENRRGNNYYSASGSVGKHPEVNGRHFVNVEDVIDDVEGFSTEAKEYTDEYKQKIEEVTQEYITKMSGLSEKYNFNTNDDVESVVVTPKGILRNQDFSRERY